MKKYKILVIEDNLEVRENIAEILNLSGYTVLDAENGIEGVKIAKNNIPDLIICDVMMPQLDGFGTLKILQNTPETSNIPFVFLTAKSEKIDFRKGMSLGADDYLTKPFDDTDLLNAVEVRLKKSKTNSSDSKDSTFINEKRALEEIQKLIENSESRKYNKKDLIYEIGDYPKKVFYISEGKVKAYQNNELGKELITHVYNNGDFFGYLPIIRNIPYFDSTTAIEDCKIHIIDLKKFSDLIFHDKDLMHYFFKLIANNQEDIEKHLIELAYSSVRKKVANSLIHLSEKYNSDELNILREDLASMSGTAKETVIRTLSDFKGEDLIEISNNTIVILNKKKLALLPQ
jgi:CheY-like chemotaxis protein/CRP-like cAMP-binding protein